MNPEEYSIAVWLNDVKILELCVGFRIGMDTEEKAAKYGRWKAIKQGLMTNNQSCEVDVSVDASDDWATYNF